MFRRLFGNRDARGDGGAPQRQRREPTFGDGPSTVPPAPAASPQRSQSDLANEAADILRKLMMSHYADDHGIHIETLLSAAAACAGYQAQQAGLWLIAMDQPEAKEVPGVNEVTTTSGEVFIFSELVNQLVASGADPNRLTVFRLVASEGARAGGSRFPDMREVARRTAAACGSQNYPPLSVPPQHFPKENARIALQRWWPIVVKIFSANELRHVSPLHRMFALSLMTGQLIEAGKDVLNPDVAMLLAMETAFAMAKVTGIKAELSS
jgi:hypothetical protein